MDSVRLKRITSIWILTVLLLFVINIVLGILMRLNQGGLIHQSPQVFYSNMTAHGITMIGIWFVAGMAAINYLLERYVQTSYSANLFAMILTVVGVVMIWSSTFIGKFHTGWTFLYPLPFYVAWSGWATPLYFASLLVLGLGWMVWSVSLMIQLLKKYHLKNALAWQHLGKNPSVETPPFVLISMISLTGIITCLLAAVLLLTLLFTEYFSKGAFVNDALLMKNLTYFFGHTIANEMLYLGLAVIYELFPEVSGRPKWKTNWYVALAWNCTLIFILTSFFHHLYMDFIQPEGFQLIGQIASYLSSIPAAAITIFSLLNAVYKTPIKWSLTNLLFFTGICGWAVGGIGAIIDATISNNFILHNTLWVPAHFHTYNAMGNVLFSLAFFNWFSNQLSGQTLNEKTVKLKLFLLIIGGAGFLLAFYIGGAQFIPRRYNIYPADFSMASALSLIGAMFATLYLTSILLLFINISGKCIKVFSSSYSLY